MFGFQLDFTEEIKNEVLVQSMPGLLNKFGLDYNSFKTTKGYNYPRLIRELAKAAEEAYQGRRVVIAVDECAAGTAPEKKVDKDEYYDWTELENIPDNVRICIAFNPQSFKPILLPTGDSFNNVETEIRYRSTISITKMVDMMAKGGYDYLVQTEDEIASDVVGDLPWVMDIGVLNMEVIENALKTIQEYRTQQEDDTSLTVLYDASFTEKSIDKLKEFGWPVFRVGQFPGWEDESIIYLGPGLMESFSRARLKLFIVLGYEGEKEMKYYNDFRCTLIQI